ncbi:MAG: D-tyrosyl-tRNA(Tyr) deacylase [Dehalococcoidia bacterium]|nr:D-tyrosyl-tRNA(Tyr) deacylase [Dehalococcoidia bacterium]
MRAIVQRVTSASVKVTDEQAARIGPGLVLLVGVRHGDGPAAASWLAEKVAHLRIFADDSSKFNRCVLDVGGSILLVSQFTVYGDCRKGRRPSFTTAATPSVAAPLLDALAEELRHRGLTVKTGVFGAMMQVSLTNDGPVTLLVDTPERLSA